MKKKYVIIKKEWKTEALIENISAIISHYRQGIKSDLIKMYHEIGSEFVKSKITFNIVELAPRLGLSKTDLYASIDFVKKFPDLDEFLKKDNITWTITKKFLIEGKEAFEECKHPGFIKVCSVCRRKL